MATALDPTKISAKCGRGQHGWCPGRIYLFLPDRNAPRLGDCQCGCACSRRVPVTRPGAARTRRRQLAERAEAATRRKLGRRATSDPVGL